MGGCRPFSGETAGIVGCKKAQWCFCSKAAQVKACQGRGKSKAEKTAESGGGGGAGGVTLSEAKAHKATCESQSVGPGYLTCRAPLSTEECGGASEFDLPASSVAAPPSCLCI